MPARCYPYAVRRLPRRRGRFSPYAGLRVRRGASPRVAAVAVGVVAAAAFIHSHPFTSGGSGTAAAGLGDHGGTSTRPETTVHRSVPKPAAPHEDSADREVIAYADARVQMHVPYVWGGTTDEGLDCSGLTQAAWASAGVTIDRTSQDQWASEKHVPASRVRPGDLVFFAGSDGTPSSPGHVGIVTDPARHQMIDEYASGFDAETDHYGPGDSTKAGNDPVVGFTDPEGGA